MSDQKLSLEDILDEYSPASRKSEPAVNSRVETEELVTSAEKIGGIRRTAPEYSDGGESRKTIKNEYTQPENHAKISTPPEEFTQADLSRSRVSFINAGVVNEIRSSSSVSGDHVYDGAEVRNHVVEEYNSPRIRRMSDSTRAREVEKIKKKKKKPTKVKNDYTYKKETPDGEYMYTPPQIKKKKRTRSVSEEAVSPENKRLITDIVPSPDAVEAAKPVKPAPRAEKTSINLSEQQNFDAGSLDVHITQEAEEFASVKSKKKRTKRIVDFNYYGDVEDVGRDIYELKSTISVRVIILALTTFLSLYITAAAQFNIPIIGILSKSNPYTYLAAHLITGLIAIISSFTVITNGMKKLFTLKADSDTMSAITALVCMIAIIPYFLTTDLLMNNTVHVYMPVGIIALLINAIGKLLIIKRAARNFKFVSKNFDRHGITYVHDEERAEVLTRGTLGDFPILASMRKTDFLTDFLRYTYSSDMTDSYCRKASPLCLLGSAIVTLVLTYFRMGVFLSFDSVAFGFSIFSMLICATSCIAMPLVANIPLENVSHRTIQNHGVMLGYQSVDDFYDANSILVSANKLFPEGSIKLNGIKLFSNTKIEEALLEAASLTRHAESVMQILFSDVIAEREEELYPIENFSYEESMGLCGWINHRRVLFGNRELMTSHNIEGVPTKTKESEYTGTKQEALYLSISGNLAAMFIVNITADRSVSYWIKRLCKKRIFLIIKSVDACVSLKRLSDLFGIPEEMMRIIPKKLHEEFDKETKKSVRLSASMACSGKFTSLAQLILGTKVVHSASIIGLIFQTVSILLGFGLCMLLIMSKAFDYNYTSAFAMIMYNLICTIFTCLAVSTRNI
jgi:Cu+-exporting ATPase